MPSLFTAIEIPEPIKSELLDLRPDDPGVKYSGSPHITLRFIGKTTDEMASSIQAKLSEVETDPYTQKISGAGAFNHHRLPHFLWIGVNECDSLLRLHQSIGQSLASLGIPLEDRMYKPHITIGRLNEPNNDIVNSFIDEQKDFKASFDTTSFCLFSSERLDGRPVYTKLATYDFM